LDFLPFTTNTFYLTLHFCCLPDCSRARSFFAFSELSGALGRKGSERGMLFPSWTALLLVSMLPLLAWCAEDFYKVI
jgi:hypothetical protein